MSGGQHLRRDPWCLAKVCIRGSGPLDQDINTDFIGNVELTWLAPICFEENTSLMCAYTRDDVLTNGSLYRREAPKLCIVGITIIASKVQSNCRFANPPECLPACCEPWHFVGPAPAKEFQTAQDMVE